MKKKGPQKCHVSKWASDPKWWVSEENALKKIWPPHLTQILKDKSIPFNLMYETHTNHHFSAQTRPLKFVLQVAPYLVRLDQLLIVKSFFSEMYRVPPQSVAELFRNMLFSKMTVFQKNKMLLFHHCPEYQHREGSDMDRMIGQCQQSCLRRGSPQWKLL